VVCPAITQVITEEKRVYSMEDHQAKLPKLPVPDFHRTCDTLLEHATGLKKQVTKHDSVTLNEQYWFMEHFKELQEPGGVGC